MPAQQELVKNKVVNQRLSKPAQAFPPKMSFLIIGFPKQHQPRPSRSMLISLSSSFFLFWEITQVHIRMEQGRGRLSSWNENRTASAGWNNQREFSLVLNYVNSEKTLRSEGEEGGRRHSMKCYNQSTKCISRPELHKKQEIERQGQNPIKHITDKLLHSELQGNVIAVRSPSHHYTTQQQEAGDGQRRQEPRMYGEDRRLIITPPHPPHLHTKTPPSTFFSFLFSLSSSA